MSSPRVYIAGPYKSDPVAGVRVAVETAYRLRRLGYLPFVPHLSMLWDLVDYNPPEFYLEMDSEWVRACDLLLRLPGESAGADAEVKVAERYGIPVFYGIAELECAIATGHK